MDNLDANLRAKVLSEALPFIRSYHGHTVVAKAGGQMLVDDDLLAIFARDISLLAMVGVRIVVVHGGGPQIAERLVAAGIPDNKVDGLRVTDAATMQIVNEVLCHDINGRITAAIDAAGGTAWSLRGADANLLQASQLKNGDYGLVGEVTAVDATVITNVPNGSVPVIAPVGCTAAGELLNINADVAAAAVAAALQAQALLFLTDTDGILDNASNVITQISEAGIREQISAGAITAGMLPKVECALQALSNGVASCRILNGRWQNALLLDLLTDAGVGTMITR